MDGNGTLVYGKGIASMEQRKKDRKKRGLGERAIDSGGNHQRLDFLQTHPHTPFFFFPVSSHALGSGVASSIFLSFSLFLFWRKQIYVDIISFLAMFLSGL